MPRGSTPPPCEFSLTACPKVKPGHSDLTDVNKRVLNFHMRCRAVGEWPDDGVVRDHATLLERVITEAENDRREETQMQISRLAITQAMLAMRRS